MSHKKLRQWGGEVGLGVDAAVGGRVRLDRWVVVGSKMVVRVPEEVMLEVEWALLGRCREQGF